METLLKMISQHAHHAHWFVFGAIILAGFNVPISTDVLIIVSAIMAATIIPEHTFHLYLALVLGCYFSAWCAYWTGRLLGPKLHSWTWFSRIVSRERLEKIKIFYEKYGLWTLILGRFIPFGVRNCIFMSSGMSRLSFGKFALMDALACSLWCSLAFWLFYALGQSYQVIWNYVKVFNTFIFIGFGVTVISFIWYKRRKKTRATNTYRP